MGETYYYRKVNNNIKVFKYNEALKGYIKINDLDIIEKNKN